MAICGAFRASSAIRCSFVETLSRVCVLFIFPSSDSHARLVSPSLHGVPRVLVPPLRRYYGELRRLVAHPASLRFLRSAVSPVGAWFARCVARPTQRLDLISGVSVPRASVKTTRPPRFPGAPVRVRHTLGPRMDLGLSHSEAPTSPSPISTVDDSTDRPPQ